MEFRGEVESGAYPEARHVVGVKEDEFGKFLAGLGQ
jgi:hypothetical protein